MEPVVAEEQDILSFAREVRDKLLGDDPEKRRRIEQKRSRIARSALELRSLVAPLAGQKVRVGSDTGILHVRADEKAAYVEYVPDEVYTATTKFDGRQVEEVRKRAGKSPTKRLRLHKDERGFVIDGFGLPIKLVSQLNDVKRYVGAVVGPLLE